MSKINKKDKQQVSEEDYHKTSPPAADKLDYETALPIALAVGGTPNDGHSVLLRILNPAAFPKDLGIKDLKSSRKDVAQLMSSYFDAMVLGANPLPVWGSSSAAWELTLDPKLWRPEESVLIKSTGNVGFIFYDLPAHKVIYDPKEEDASLLFVAHLQGTSLRDGIDFVNGLIGTLMNESGIIAIDNSQKQIMEGDVATGDWRFSFFVPDLPKLALAMGATGPQSASINKVWHKTAVWKFSYGGRAFSIRPGPTCNWCDDESHTANSCTNWKKLVERQPIDPRFYQTVAKGVDGAYSPAPAHDEEGEEEEDSSEEDMAVDKPARAPPAVPAKRALATSASGDPILKKANNPVVIPVPTAPPSKKRKVDGEVSQPSGSGGHQDGPKPPRGGGPKRGRGGRGNFRGRGGAHAGA